jgi:hypothetical protein
MRGLDPRIHRFAKKPDRRVIGERSDAVLRTAMPGDDIECVATGLPQNEAGAALD